MIGADPASEPSLRSNVNAEVVSEMRVCEDFLKTFSLAILF